MTQKVESVTISKGGSDYTYGTVNLTGRVPKGTTSPSFDVIIPPAGGHGADIYRELGAYNVLTIQDLKMIRKTQTSLLVMNLLDWFD